MALLARLRYAFSDVMMWNNGAFMDGCTPSCQASPTFDLPATLRCSKIDQPRIPMGVQCTRSLPCLPAGRLLGFISALGTFLGCGGGGSGGRGCHTQLRRR